MHELLSKKLHIFDLDDTLINTREAYGNAQKELVKKIVEEVKGKNFEEEFKVLRWFSTLFSSSNPEGYFTAYSRHLSEDCGFSMSAEEMLSIYNDYYWSHLKCFEKIKNYIELLLSKDLKLSIVSNGYTNLQLKKLRSAGLIDYFSLHSIFVSDMFSFKNKKPSPFMIQQACVMSKTETDDAVYYGNITEDIVSGNLANVSTVFIGDKDFKEDVQVTHLSKPNLILKNRWLELNLK